MRFNKAKRVAPRNNWQTVYVMRVARVGSVR